LTSIDAIINRQLLRWELERKKAEEEAREHPEPLPIITVSRQTGSRASYFASRLAQRLGYPRIDRQVIDAICTSSGYRKRIVEALDDHFRSDIQVMVDSLITGQAVDSSDYVKHLFRVILSMSRLGGIVVMGRGSNYILGPKRGVHMRVVCPMEKRIENLMKYKGLSHDEAIALIEESDQQRSEFVSKVFHRDINDPHYYDVVFNSALIDVEEMVETAIMAVEAKMEKLKYLDNDRL
jgi:cytidylate kinase